MMSFKFFVPNMTKIIITVNIYIDFKIVKEDRILL